MTKTWLKHYHQIVSPPDEHYTEEGFVHDMWPQWNILDEIEKWLYTGQFLQTGRCPTSTEDCAVVPQRADPVGLSSDWFKMHSSCIQLHFKLLVAKAKASPCAKDLQRNSEKEEGKKELVAIPACAWWKALFIKKKNQHITIWAMNIFDFAPQICGATQPSLLPFSIPGDFGFLLHSWECFQFPVYLSGMKDDLNYWLDLWSFL